MKLIFHDDNLKNFNQIFIIFLFFFYLINTNLKMLKNYLLMLIKNLILLLQ